MYFLDRFGFSRGRRRECCRGRSGGKETSAIAGFHQASITVSDKKLNPATSIT
jgi:hypothetical protein